ncbi:B-cell differentiation antigen CD72 isoform X1 [Loxodonta africana]|uniref:B-cell differentiation antigen CD72 isoform X1 n=1 Tax=Loxodonta africana TaxID=9785 RepID=UPI0030D4044B
MAEAITYADLRFVKAPLKKSISTRLEQDTEDYENGELTYENVQVPSAPEWPGGMAPPGPRDKAEVKPEQPPAAWSTVTSAAAGRVLPCCAAYMHLLLLGLLLTCLMLAVAAICLGMRYLQVSQQLQQMDSVLEATNSSLRQQLHRKITQEGKREEELQGSRRELAQSQKALQGEQGRRQAAEGQLQACQSDKEKTEENLQREERQRSTLEQRLSNMQDTLKPFFKCSSPENCCPVGWIQKRKSCFYFSPTQKSWEDSRKHCKSLSSDLAVLKDLQSQYYSSRSDSREIINLLTSDGNLFESCWIGLSLDKNWKWIDGTPVSESRIQSSRWLGTQNSNCAKVQMKYWAPLQQEDCSNRLPCICEMPAFRHPDGEHSLHLN